MTDDSKTKGGWTYRQRLVYLFNLIEYSKMKLDFTNAPRPEGKSVGACRIMVDRLKGSLKEEIGALRSGVEMGEGSPKKATPRKRKAKADEGEGGEARKKQKRNIKVLGIEDEI